MVFNAFKYVEVLKDAGVPDKQAQAQVRILNEILESNLATKQDVEIIKRDLKELEQRMIIKLGVLLTIAVTAIAIFLK